MYQENESFQIVNNWLGTGDPDNGLWFIGMEEADSFTNEVVESYRGKQYAPVLSSDAIKSYNRVANMTAKIVATLCGIPSQYQKYRDSFLWRKGSKVFNGNLLPLGRPKRTSWPKENEELFGLSHKDYIDNFSIIKDDRINKFKKFRTEKCPQAIVCFGKQFWNEFAYIFATEGDPKISCGNNLAIFEHSKTILTGHFSYGTWMPKKSVEDVAKKLLEWGVVMTTPK